MNHQGFKSQTPQFRNIKVMQPVVVNVKERKLMLQDTKAVVIDLDAVAIIDEEDEQQNKIRQEILSQQKEELQWNIMDAMLKSGNKYDIIINPPEFHLSQDLTEQQKEENKQKMVKFLQTAIKIGNQQKYESISIPACLKSMKNLKPKTEIFQAIFDAIDQYDLSKQSSSGSLKVIKIILEDEQESELFNAISQKMYIQRQPYSLLIEDHMKKEQEKQNNEISELKKNLQLIVQFLSPKMNTQNENLN
ncbi:UNKNOWN [Stylonychia lemnae]|uniref:Uncharacterized protein n=1 Tax=Stylonychia lemnae TaxID=5949 RepID=A0A078ALQ3_STYLE|nr:UNKNOWN [Stylonychia lemnae]|eukprot:CDW83280.1 UNKNOWN [Stylonychia lemnae]